MDIRNGACFRRVAAWFNYGIKYVLMFAASLAIRGLVKRWSIWTIRHHAYRTILTGAVLLILSVNLFPLSLLALVLPMVVIQIGNGFFDPANRIVILEKNPDQTGITNSLQVLLHVSFEACASVVVAMMEDTLNP